MQRLTLGRSGIEVSEYCLGTMTWGNQNTEAEGHAQIDMALDHGVDFIDTAEMYPVNPVTAETVGRTEEVIGSWIAKTGRRSDIVLATKVSGPGRIIRSGQPVSPETLEAALTSSLARLQTDYIDLYQLHWPNRGSYHFRQNWSFDPSAQNGAEERETIHALCEALDGHVKAGRIRAWGLSNDSAWGTMQWLAAAEATGGPRVSTIQNEYSLLCRFYDLDLAELAVHEDITLLAYSPLAMGLLTGKYRGGARPAGTRLERGMTNLGARMTDRSTAAVEAYAAIAEAHGLSLTQMALAFTRSRPAPTIPIFGATSLEQLGTALGAAEITLGAEILAEIEAAHKDHPMTF